MRRFQAVSLIFFIARCWRCAQTVSCNICAGFTLFKATWRCLGRQHRLKHSTDKQRVWNEAKSNTEKTSENNKPSCQQRGQRQDCRVVWRAIQGHRGDEACPDTVHTACWLRTAPARKHGWFVGDNFAHGQPKLEGVPLSESFLYHKGIGSKEKSFPVSCCSWYVLIRAQRVFSTTSGSVTESDSDCVCIP